MNAAKESGIRRQETGGAALDLATPNDRQLDAVMGFASVAPIERGGWRNRYFVWEATIPGISVYRIIAPSHPRALTELRELVARCFSQVVAAVVVKGSLKLELQGYGEERRSR